MSTKYNQLYNNPALTRAFSNIANTLIGSASDDAAIARANYLRSQTEGQDLKNKNMIGLQKSIEPTTNVLASNILRSFTGQPNAQFNQSGVPIVDGGNMSMPVSGNINVMPPADMTKENYSNVARAMLGDLTYNPQQFAGALNTLGKSEREMQAQNLITSGNADDRRAGFNLLGKSPGQFFDSGSAEYATDRKTEVGLDKNKREAQVKKQIGLDKNQKVFDIGKYKHDNRDISIAVGKDKQLIVDKATGKKLGITPQIINGKKVYVFDGRQTVDKIEVKVGKSDVYMSKERAEKLGIKPNSNGQYIIKGSGYNDGSGGGSGGSGGSGKDAIKPKDFMKLVSDSLANEGNKPIFTDKLPGNIIGGVKKEMKKIYDKEIAKINAGTAKGDTSTAYIKTIEFIISRGVVDVSTGNFSSTAVPKFFYDSYLKTNTNIEDMTKWFQGIGYSKDIASKIANDIFTKRAQNG